MDPDLSRDFRVAQLSFAASRWDAVPPLTDWELSQRGYQVVGARIVTDALTDDERSLLARHWHGYDVDSRRIVGELLARCDRIVHVPPVDVDICARSRHHDPDRSRELAMAFARAFTATALAHGLPLRWSVTSPDKGSLHGDWTVDPSVRSPFLFLAAGNLVRTIAREVEAEHALGVQLLSDVRGASKVERPAVVLDDSVYQRFPDSKGSLWRPIGAAKPGTDQHKSWIMGELRVPASYSSEATAPDTVALPVAVEAVVAQVSESQLVAARARVDRERSCGTRLRGEVEHRYEVAPPELVERALDRSRLRMLWGTPEAYTAGDGLNIDRSKRDFCFAISSREAGFTEAETVQLVKALPASKASTRGPAYLDSLMRSVGARLEQRRIEQEPTPRERASQTRLERKVSHRSGVDLEAIYLRARNVTGFKNLNLRSDACRMSWQEREVLREAARYLAIVAAFLWIKYPLGMRAFENHVHLNEVRRREIKANRTNPGYRKPRRFRTIPACLDPAKLMKTLANAARCGLYSEQVFCPDGKELLYKFKHVADNAACPHCLMSYNRSVVSWCEGNWKGPYEIHVVRFKDTSWQFMERVRRDRKKFLGKRERALRAATRDASGPGILMTITMPGHDTNPIADWLLSYPEAEAYGYRVDAEAEVATSVLQDVLYARATYLRELIATRDPVAIASDPWFGRIRPTRAGASAVAWPTDPEIKQLIMAQVNASRAKQEGVPVETFAPPPSPLNERGECAEHGCRPEFHFVDHAGRSVHVSNRPHTINHADYLPPPDFEQIEREAAEAAALVADTTGRH